MDESNLPHTEWVQSALRKFEAPLTRYAVRITGDVERARDVVQDTFVRLWAQDASRLNGKLAEWLFTVCRRRALDVQRKERRMAVLDDLQLEACESAEPSPADAAEHRESGAQGQRDVGFRAGTGRGGQGG